MNKLDYCFHTHTERCGHASGEDIAYVEKAIEYGMVSLGFSDHGFLPFMNQPGMRGDYRELGDYVKSVWDLQGFFKSEIKIYLGFEMEWLGDGHVDYLRSLYRDHGFDYLILGHHMFFEGDRGRWFWGQPRYEGINRYADEVCTAMRSGLYLYVAHPDLFMDFAESEWGDIEKDAARRIIMTAVETDTPLEINMGRIRGGYLMGSELGETNVYPYLPFWKMVKDMGAKVVVGVDAHAPHNLVDERSFNKALGVARMFDIEPLTHEEIERRIEELKARNAH